MKKKVLILTATMTVFALCGLTGCWNETTSKTKAEETTVQIAAEMATEEMSVEVASTEAATENAAEATTQAPKVEMYTTEDIYLMSKADKESDQVTVIPVNTKVTVLKEGKEWTKVKYDSKKGYVYTEYLTESADEAEQAKVTKAEEEAAQKAAEEAAAAAEAEKAAASKSSKSSGKSGSSSKKSSGKKVVSKQKHDDCDGSGHGYYEIKYSDGSTEIKEY